MSEINLLPDELRDKEEKELKSVRRKPKNIVIDMSSPSRDVVDQPLVGARPSLMSRLFTKKVQPGKPLPPSPAGVKQKSFDQPLRSVEKTFNIPKVSGGGASQSQVDSGESNISLPGRVAEAQPQDRMASFNTNAESNSSRTGVPSRQERVIEHQAGSARIKFGWFSKLFKLGQPSKVKGSASGADTDLSEDEIKFKNEGSARSRDTILDVNLIPEEMNRHPEVEFGKKIFASAVVVGFCVLLVVFGYFGLTWYQVSLARQAQTIQEETVVLDQAIGQFEEDRLAARDFQSYLGLVRYLLDNHVYWSKFFESLEKYTTQKVYYTNFSMAGTNRLVVSAVALDYEAIAEQIVAFQQATDFIKEVRVDSATALLDKEDGSYRGVNFTVSLEFLPAVFLNPIDSQN